MSNKDKKEWTWQEISEHCDRKSCWLYVGRDVYDVTSWLPRHPGGEELVLLFSGRDCTESFRAYHPFTDKPYAILEKYKIGTLKGPSELVRWKEDDGFYKAVREKCGKYFKDNKIDPIRQSIGYEAYRFISSIGFYLFGHYLLTKVFGEWGVPLLVRMLLAIPWGLCAVMIALNVGHMASHVPTFHAPVFNRFLGWFTFDVCLGLSWKMWLHEHVVGHHQYTNIITIDPNAPEGHGDEALYRSSPNQQWYNRFARQYIWLPLISFLLITEYRVASFRYWLKGFRKEIRVNREFLGPDAFAMFVLGKFLWFYRVFYVPIAWWGRPVGETLAIVLFSELTAGYFVGITFPANHITDKVDWPTMTKDEKTQEMKIGIEWAVMQIQTCKDYSPESWIFSHVFGGLNNHSCHHLFPAMHHSYYAEIYPIVKQVAKDYKVKLPDVAGYWDLVYDYFNNLRVLSDEKSGKQKYI